MNIKRLLALLPAALLLCFVIGCEDDDSTYEYAAFEYSEIEVSASTVLYDLSVNSAVIEWVLTKDSDATWMEFDGDTASDTTTVVSLILEQNITLEDREATLTLTYTTDGEEITKTLTFIQLAEEDCLQSLVDTVFVDYQAQSYIFDVESNRSWKAYNTASWVTMSEVAVKLVEAETMQFTFEENTGLDYRIVAIPMVADNGYTSQVVAVQYGHATIDTDKDALIELYDATGGSAWTNSWDVSGDITSWHGVTVEETANGQRVTALDLSNNGLVGAIPESIGHLQYLKTLSLYGNELSGEIPETIGDIHYMEYLYLHENQLTGEIPEVLADLQYIYRIHLGDNELAGEIPSTFGDAAPNIYVFGMSNNNLTGTLPEPLGYSTVLYNINVSGNRLSGYVPDSYKNNALWRDWSPTENIYTQQEGYILE